MYVTLDWPEWKDTQGDQTYYQKNEEDSWESQFFEGDSEYSQKLIFYCFRICIFLELEIQIGYEKGTL